MSRYSGVRWALVACAAVGLVFWASGCGGPAKKKQEDLVEKISSDKEFPDDLPVEMREKFKVAQDEEPASTDPKSKAKKKKKKKKKRAFKYPNRRPKGRDPIWLGEQQVLEITYFGVPAGDFTLDVLPFKTIDDRKVYHIKGVAKSSKVFSVFYRINDTVESFFDYMGLFSHRFHLVLDESKQSRDSLELYDHRKKQTYYWDRWNHWKKGFREKKEYHPIEAFSLDSISALYYVRTQDLPNGRKFSFPVNSEGKTWHAEVNVLRRETLNTPIGKIRAIVLKPETYFQGVLKKRGDSFIWLSDDERRWVLRVEAKVKIGTVKAVLKSVKDGTRPL